MRVILSGGGTGGHIYPALTIAKALQKAEPDCQILFVGTSHGLEADIIPKEGYNFTTIEVKGWERGGGRQNISLVFRTIGSVWQSRKIIKLFKPDIVIGTGGYVCGPVLLAASLMGKPTLIQEQNVIPGVTNRILAYFADGIAVGYPEAVKRFARRAKIEVTGNPIRPEIMTATREDGLRAYGLSREKLTILAFGGSRGARSINRAMLDVYRYFAGSTAVQLLHVTGQNEYNDIVDRAQQSGIDITNSGNIIIKPYLYDMPLALAAADLAISRAGAIGLAELTARGLPAILIPYPYAAENHQQFNAQVMGERGAAVVIRDADLNGRGLSAAIENLIDATGKLKKMSEASKSLGRPAAADKIAGLAGSLARRR